MSKILIADDEPHIQQLLEQTLEDLEDKGVELLLVGNGTEALAIIKRERPELVFLDVMMPGMSGFDVCETVKKKLALPGIFIVILTAKGQEFDKERGFQAGVDVYMTKPFDPDLIMEKARDVLGIQ
jgi:DNA-binding response OmpR family regulator